MWKLSSDITINCKQFVINLCIDKYQLYTILIQFQIENPYHHGT